MSGFKDASESMENPPTTMSQAQLVNGPHPGRKLPQYLAAMAATLGALAAGAMLGWSSPAEPRLTNGEYGFPVSKDQNAWIGSLTTLGAACVCIPIGILMDKIGRKLAMLLLVLPFTLGWLLIILATNVDMLYAGRFFIGVAGGAFCVTAPTYTSEIAQDDIRGALGSMFQLMITIGILFTYVVGSYVEVYIMSILCLAIPIIFGIVFFFMPETPYFLVNCGKIEEAKKSLIWLRGAEYDSDTELSQIKEKVEESRNNPVSFKQAFSKRSAILAFVICMSLMLFQQFSGINAVIFNVTTIFKSASDAIPEDIATIIIGVVQVVATFLSTLIVDKLGRRVLLLLSAIVMAICDILLGVFFYLKETNGADDETVQSISWLPLASLIIFIAAFSLGFGPIPWLVSGELCTPNIKAFVSSTAGTFNWLLAFVVTRTFVSMQSGLGEGGAFWLFAGFTVVGVVFVFFVIPETKGKSIDEIQNILNRENK
ncbi:solute carrier family 2 member nebulosa isoform X2 [Arctopsyche grandis]|uniref:solute carrier family 2 member nebulosa isoform X2 n=1 Tax=Arctopsyche grandis TaxID=121162 RepID=UPI00406D6DA8